jgi:hypothetical protein
MAKPLLLKCNPSMKKILILLLFISTAAAAQKIPDYGFNKVRITDGDKTIQAELKPIKNAPDVETDRLYFWYGSNIIHTTQGGFSGRLLNGDYSEYYLSKNLKEQGLFDEGLKNGIWKSWDDNGNLIQLYTWQKGIKDGKFTLYDSRGVVKQTGEYDSGLLDGPVKLFDQNGVATIVLYKNGTVIANKPVSFWQKINFFKKKQASTNMLNKPKSKSFWKKINFFKKKDASTDMPGKPKPLINK